MTVLHPEVSPQWVAATDQLGNAMELTRDPALALFMRAENYYHTSNAQWIGHVSRQIDDLQQQLTRFQAELARNRIR